MTERRIFLRNAALATVAVTALPTRAKERSVSARPGLHNTSLFNIMAYGAVGDGKTMESQSIQKAIVACYEAGGGVVYFPPGDYLSGSLVVKSNVTLYLENGAILHASPHEKDYIDSEHREDGHPQSYYYLLISDSHNYITIDGNGTIHGTGKEDLGRRGLKNEVRPDVRIGILHFKHCNHVNIRNIKIYYSDFWTLHLNRCQDVFIQGINIINNFYHVNSDAIDLVSCRNVFISDCNIVAGDDCICSKTQEGIPCENVVVNNCVLESVSAAIKLGTGSDGDFRDIHFSNCSIRNSGVGIGFFIKDGGRAERIAFSNISIETSDSDSITQGLFNHMIPIYLDIEKRYKDSPVGSIRDVTFRDISIKTDVNCLIQGMPQSPVENLTMENITIRVDKGRDFSSRRKRGGGVSNVKDARITTYIRRPSYLALAHIQGLILNNIRVLVEPEVSREYERSGVSIFESENIHLQDIRLEPSWTDASQPVVFAHQCRSMFVTGCFALPETNIFLAISGEHSSDISVRGCDLENAKDPVNITDITYLKVRMDS